MKSVQELLKGDIDSSSSELKSAVEALEFQILSTSKWTVNTQQTLFNISAMEKTDLIKGRVNGLNDNNLPQIQFLLIYAIYC
ncbi:hypothetical protein NQ317_016351 [Molorchus minor]|uniref:Uncharacterized protein n=1 Tax=Molorchus minor TaxID=1323400 RepID=A0ABQ9IYJ1_9CUCU|nr:hypothetical protein NQ317_016351 [Molorchus minor]